MSETNPPQIIKFTRPVSSNLTQAFEGGVKAIGTRIADPADKRVLVAQPVYLVDPEAAQSNAASLDIASVIALDTNYANNPALAAVTANRASLHRLYKPGQTIVPGGGSNVWQYGADAGSQGFLTVSAVHAAQNFTIDMREGATILAIDMLCSGGTATLVVAVSVDGSTFIQVDSIAAALQTDLQYTQSYYTINGAGTANGGAGASTVKLNPLAFRYVKITAGDAGVGNTTTLTVGVK